MVVLLLTYKSEQALNSMLSIYLDNLLSRAFLFICSLPIKTEGKQYNSWSKCCFKSYIHQHATLTPCFKLSFAWSAMSDTTATAAVGQRKRNQRNAFRAHSPKAYIWERVKSRKGGDTTCSFVFVTALMKLSDNRRMRLQNQLSWPENCSHLQLDHT